MANVQVTKNGESYDVILSGKKIGSVSKWSSNEWFGRVEGCPELAKINATGCTAATRKACVDKMVDKFQKHHA